MANSSEPAKDGASEDATATKMDEFEPSVDQNSQIYVNANNIGSLPLYLLSVSYADMTSNFLISIPLASINQFCVEMNLNVDAVKKLINPNYFQIVDVPCKTSLYCFAALVSSFTGEKPMTLVLALVAFLMQKTFGYMWMFVNCFCADGLYFKKELTPMQTLV